MLNISRFYLVLATVSSALVPIVHSYTSYANDFVDPNLILSKSFSPITIDAQKTIISWADELSTQGPWSTPHMKLAHWLKILISSISTGVVYKNYTPPSGNKHDYASLAP